MLPAIAPILPVLSKVVPMGKEWRYEPKIDGFRGLLHFDGKEAWFLSKTRKRMARFRDLAAHLATEIGAKSVILDGEIVVMADGRPDFYALMQAKAEPSYAAFDLLYLNGRDFRTESFTARKMALRRLMKRAPSILYIEPHREPGLYSATVKMDLEGIVAKRISDPYAPETEWVKVKNATYTQKEGRGELFRGQR